MAMNCNSPIPNELKSASLPENRTVKEMHSELHGLLSKANSMARDICLDLDSSRILTNIDDNINNETCLVNALENEIVYARSVCDSLCNILEILGG